MRRIVKLNDLEDMAELPLNGSIEASPRNQKHQEGNGMEMEVGSSMGTPSSHPFSSKDINLSLE